MLPKCKLFITKVTIKTNQTLPWCIILGCRFWSEYLELKLHITKITPKNPQGTYHVRDTQSLHSVQHIQIFLQRWNR